MPELPVEGQDPAAVAPEEGADDGVQQITDLIQNVSQGLGMISEVMQGAGAPPEIAQQVAQMSEDFKALMKQAMGGQGPASEAVPQESGGRPGAIPQSPAVR